MLLLTLILLFTSFVVVGLLLTILRRISQSNVAYVNLEATTSLEEIVSSLDRAANLAATVANELEINVAEARQQFSRLVVLLNRLQIDMTATGESGERVEADQAYVAGELAAIQRQARESEKDVAPGTIADIAAGGLGKSKPRKPKSKRS